MPSKTHALFKENIQKITPFLIILEFYTNFFILNNVIIFIAHFDFSCKIMVILNPFPIFNFTVSQILIIINKKHILILNNNNSRTLMSHSTVVVFLIKIEYLLVDYDAKVSYCSLIVYK